MRYNAEMTLKIVEIYEAGNLSVPEIAEKLSQEFNTEVPERSVISKLSNLGIYKKKRYLTKRGEVPISKATHIEYIAESLGVLPKELESLGKVNKRILALLASRV